MDVPDLMTSSAPWIVFCAMGFLVVIELFLFCRKNDLLSWKARLDRDARHAAEDPQYRQNELAKTEILLEKTPAPAPVLPVTRQQEFRLGTYPKIILILGVLGVVSLCVGVLFTMPRDVFWPIWIGWALIAVNIVLYCRLAKPIANHVRVKLLNKKYLFQKAGGDAGRYATLDQIEQYYPDRSLLKLERAEQQAADGKLDAAVTTVEKAFAADSASPELALGLTSLQLRRDDADAAEKALAQAETSLTNAADPRVDVYRAAVFARRGEKEKALEHAGSALKKGEDAVFALVSRDTAALEPLKRLLEAENMLPPTRKGD